MEMAGESPSIESTSGFSICSRNWRGGGGGGRAPGARRGGARGEPVPGDLQVDVLEVVLPRAADDDPVEGHGAYLRPEAIRAAIRMAASRLAGVAGPLPPGSMRLPRG